MTLIPTKKFFIRLMSTPKVLSFRVISELRKRH